MQVKRIAECSKESILQYFRPLLSYHLSLSIFEWPFYTGFTVSYWYQDKRTIKISILKKYRSRHENTKNVHQEKTPTSLDINLTWAESSLSLILNYHWAHSDDSDLTEQMTRLIWVFAGCPLILLILSCQGSCCGTYCKRLMNTMTNEPWHALILSCQISCCRTYWKRLMNTMTNEPWHALILSCQISCCRTYWKRLMNTMTNEPWHVISNNVEFWQM